MTPLRLGLAVGAGLALGALPFLRYAHLGHDAVPHANHAARHGGELVMVGDHHLEVVRQRGRVEVYASDAIRQPLRPRRGEITFEGDAAPVELVWEGHRLTGPDRANARAYRLLVVLDDGTRLRLRR